MRSFYKEKKRINFRYLDVISGMLYALIACALLTSIISGVAGMAGGVLLLSAMTFFLDIKAIVPIHGVVQMMSNSSRCWYLRSNVRLDLFWPYLVGAPIGFVFAYFILQNISQTHYLYLLISLLIFWALFKPKKLPEIRLRSYQWTVLGAVAGLQSALIGATGPLLAVFFLRSDLKKEEIVATKAMQQLTTHFLKIPLFLSLSFPYEDYLILMSGMALTTVAGSFIGVKILKAVNEKSFQYIFRSLLFIAALRMLYKFWEAYNV